MKFICDPGANHNQDKGRYIDLIKAAHDAGAWAVKPQYYRVSELFTKKSHMTDDWNLPKEFIEIGKNECSKLGMKFGVSIFHDSDFDFLNQYVDFWKISSFDVLRFDLIQKCLDTKKKTFISIGLMTGKVLKHLLAMVPAPILFHCISKYPVKHKEANLFVLSYAFILGYSCHSIEPGVIYRACAYDIQYVELHLGLDGKGLEEAYSKHCWLPEDLKRVIKDVKIGKEAVPCNLIIGKEELKQLTNPKTGKRP